METLGEQPSKGPRCQETKGVEGASARQKTSTTKRSKDPPRVVNIPKRRYKGDEIGNSVSTSADYQIEEADDEVGAEKKESSLKESTEAESSKAAETVKLAAVKAQAAVTESAAVTGLSVEEIEIAETLVKAKNDTQKATQKAKGVIIKEGGS
ncbi:hypothetical protein L6452_17331 [Arctium lappa]|uniref:Uncharacterized protein n=1 Tax=Arctium lappa TaxID=4217 RepID=A0ACB9C388_ARCLA|nr:hypothetical protein L6452_17331 [Arctium lappa]